MTEERGPFESRAEVEMSSLSGVVKIVVRAKPTALAVLLEAGGIALCVWYEMGDTNRSILHLGTEAFVLLSAVVTFLYLLGGQEVIEFDRENLTIRRTLLEWERVSRYPIEKCTELTWRVQERRDHFGLECKVGRRRIKFARFASERQSSEMLAYLQQYLPAVAQRIGRMPGGDAPHFTTLGLSNQ